MTAMPPPAANQPVQPAVRKPGKGLAIAALILGIIALIPVLGILPGLAGLVLGLIALSKPAAKGLAAIGLVLSILGLLISGVGIFWGVGKARGGAQEAMCMANAHAVSTAVLFYQAAHNDQYPPSLDVLIREGTISAKTVECPALKVHQPGGDFVYAPPAKGSPSMGVVLAEKQPTHDGKRTVGFADGHVQIVDEAEFQRLLTQPQNAAFAAAFNKARR